MRYTHPMKDEPIAVLIERRQQLLDELVGLTHLVHGSWVERYSTCSRVNCRCHRGEKHGPRYYVVVQEKGKQRQKYIPRAQAAAVRQGLAQSRKLQEIVAEVTRINLLLIKKRGYEDS